jgi:hypothetical protein
MEKDEITLLEEPILRSLNQERATFHTRMKKNGFVIDRNRLMRYGCIITFFHQGEKGWMMIYKNKKNRSNFCFSFIYSSVAINCLLTKVRPKEIAQGQYKLTYPDIEKRGKIKWWREHMMRKQ